MDSCAPAHYWAREIGSLGHEVRMMVPQYVKAYVKTSKNGAADAEAIYEAAQRPTMRFVRPKSPDQQAISVWAQIQQITPTPDHSLSVSTANGPIGPTCSATMFSANSLRGVQLSALGPESSTQKDLIKCTACVCKVKLVDQTKRIFLKAHALGFCSL